MSAVNVQKAPPSLFKGLCELVYNTHQERTDIIS